MQFFKFFVLQEWLKRCYC